MEFHQTQLPGVGIRYDFTTQAGEKLALVSRNSGRRDLMAYDQDDEDSANRLCSFTESESEAVAELLGAARITGAMAELQQRIDGLAIDWLTIAPGSTFEGRVLGDTQARSRTGTSIVAVVRKKAAFPAPTPAFPFEGGDVLVVVGTPGGIAQLSEILTG